MCQAPTKSSKKIFYPTQHEVGHMAKGYILQKIKIVNGTTAWVKSKTTSEKIQGSEDKRRAEMLVCACVSKASVRIYHGWEDSKKRLPSFRGPLANQPQYQPAFVFKIKQVGG